MYCAVMGWPNDVVLKDDAFVPMELTVIIESVEQKKLRTMDWRMNSHHYSGHSGWHQ
jgi:hypothetical protein